VLETAAQRGLSRERAMAVADAVVARLALAAPEEEWGHREARILSRMGEARYWLAEFEEAASVLERALDLGGNDQWTVAHASRFLGDIELNVRARPDLAENLFRAALEASRELKDPYAEARSLIMGAWVPYWRDDHDTARKMFEEGLVIARSNPEGDRWAEARALTSLASVVAGVDDEAHALALAEEALAIGKEMHDPFTTAVAQQYMGNSLRRMWRLEEGLSLLDGAVRTFRDLDARWEQASALSDRGNLHRLLGHSAAAEEDLRATVRMCKDLRARNLITWTVERLVRVLVERGELAEARRALAESEPMLDPSDPGARASLARSEQLIALASGDREAALERAREHLEVTATDAPNDRAEITWWMGRIFGADEVGGPETLEEARAILEAHHWIQSLREPVLLLGAVEGPGVQAVPLG
jgi:tetratricopeptide (TPR) repeat protein